MMRVLLMFFSLMLAFNSYGQLKGAVPQKDQPNHMGEERKVARTTPESLAKNNADKLKKSLKLDEKQYKELYAALLEYEKGVAANAKSKLSKKEQFNKLNQLNARRQEQLKKILSKEQYHAYIMSFP